MSVGLFLPQVPRQSMEEALDVRGTLSKANAVLQTHREKMKRRSSSISPFPPSDPPPQPLPPPSLLSGWTEEQEGQEDEEIEEVSLAAPQKGVAKLLSGGRGRVAPIQSVWEDKENQVDTPTELFVINDEDSSPLCSRTTKETIPSESQEVPLFSLQTTPTTSHNPPSQDALSPSLPFSPSIQRVTPTSDTNTEDNSSFNNVHTSTSTHMSPSTPALSHPPSSSNLPSLSSPSLSSPSLPPPPLSPPLSVPAPSTKQLSNDKSVHDDDDEDDDEEMTESELLEYQLFLKKLQSSSSGRVVTVAPAPSDRRSSYLKHNRSKVGVENVTAMTTSTSNLNAESRPSSSSGSVIGVSEKEPIRMVQVLPVNYPGKGRGAVIVRSGDDNNNNNDSEKRMEKEKEENDDDVAEHSNNINKTGDLIIEETDEWIPPTDGPLHPSLSPSLSHYKEDIEVDECDNEEDLSATDSRVNEYQSEPQSLLRRNESQSSKRNESQSKSISDSQARTGSQTKRNGSESKKNGSASKKKGSKSKRNESESNRNGSESNRNGSQPERSDENRNTANLSSVSSELTLVDISEEKEEEEEEGVNSLQSMENDKSKNINNGVLDEMEREEEKEEEKNEMIPEMPLLRVKSTTSLYVPDYEYQSKRKRDTPSYDAHCINSSTALGPPCPLYGVTQPTEAEIAKMSLKQLRSPVKRNSTDNENSSFLEKRKTRDERAGSRKREKRDLSTSLSSSSSLSSLSPSLQYYNREIETDLSLHKGASDGNHRMLQQLLSKGYNVNGIDQEGATALMHCVLPSGGVQLACADLLIRKGANIDQQAIDGSTALHSASVVGSVSFIQLLLMNGANPNARDNDGRLPLHWATAAHSVEALELLLKESQYDVDVTDGSDMTPLMWSCYNKNELIAKRLIELGADVHEKDTDGRTAAHWAAKRSDINMLKLILKPDMTYFKDVKGCTVMHVSAHEGCEAGIEYIMSLRPESVHDTDKMGRTPLHYAATMDRVHICYYLLNKGADASQRDNDNKTPLDYALIKQHEFVVALFTCHDASVGDFIKMQRSEADTDSVYSGATSDGCSLVSESMSFIAPSEYTNTISLTGSINHYLGYFIPGDNKSPPLHYYFWIKNSKLYWSRSIKRHNRRKGTVLSVTGEASQRIKDREDYSPNDLHRYSFCVITEEDLLDLIAYSEDSFKYWMQSLNDISVHNKEMVQERIEEEEGEIMEEEGAMCRDDEVMGSDGFSSGPSPLFSSTPLHNGQTRTLYPNNVI